MVLAWNLCYGVESDLIGWDTAIKLGKALFWYLYQANSLFFSLCQRLQSFLFEVSVSVWRHNCVIRQFKWLESGWCTNLKRIYLYLLLQICRKHGFMTKPFLWTNVFLHVTKKYVPHKCCYCTVIHLFFL